MCTSSDPSKSSEDISAYTGASGYLYMFIRLYNYFNKQSEKEEEGFSSKSHLVGDELIYKLKDPHFYVKLAEKEYELLKNHLSKRKKEPHCFSFLISEVSVWLCGMHLGFIQRNHALFRDNEERIYKCFHTLK
jgi:lantibiotic modifying enzyme